MTPPRGWNRGLVWLGAVLAVILVTGSARADVVFRKKAPAATDSAGAEASPTGGEAAATEGGESAPKVETVPQAEDKDFPEAEQLRQKKAADAALARQMKAAQDSKKNEGPPLYTKWEFWAITGGAVVAGVLAIWAGSAVWHQMRGGDVRGCDRMTSTPVGCYGAGR
jgi:hypothetical protein